MAFDVLDLRLFVHIVEQGSITGGAETTNLSLAAASARLSTMERLARSELVRRHRRGVTPTRQGELLLAHARDIVGRHERMQLELADISGGRLPTVTVLVNTAAASLLPGIVIDHLTERPGVDLDLVEQPSHRIVADLAEGRAELGVLADSTDLGRLQTESLGDDDLVVLASASHPLAQLESVAFADIVDEPFVGHVRGNPLEEHIDTHIAPLGGRVRYRVRLPDTSAVRRAVAAGIGVAVAPARHGGDGVVAVPLCDDWARRGLVLATLRWSALSRPAGEFADRILATTRRHRGAGSG